MAVFHRVLKLLVILWCRHHVQDQLKTGLKMFWIWERFSWLRPGKVNLEKMDNCSESKRDIYSVPRYLYMQDMSVVKGVSG